MQVVFLYPSISRKEHELSLLKIMKCCTMKIRVVKL